MNLLKQKINLFGENVPWLESIREKARAEFMRIGLPNEKCEAWKYSYFKPEVLDNLQIDDTPHKCDAHDGCDEHCGCNVCECTEHCGCGAHDVEVKNLPFPAIEIKFCNGKPAHIEHKLPRGVIIMSLFEAFESGELKKYLHKSFELANFPLAALNTALFNEGIFVLITENSKISEPVYLHYRQHAGRNRMCNIRNVFVLEKGAKATIIEHFDADDGAKYFDNAVNEIFIGSESSLKHYKLQNEAKNAHHVALNCVQVKADGKYIGFVAQNECALARHESYIQLLQKNAAAEVNGAYCLKHNGVSDITTNIRHLAEKTNSAQLVKGVVNGSAKGVFQGQIHIAPNAQQTEGTQLHRALILSDEAEVDCKPELEIFADGVKCSHGAASGDLDAEQLFYMQSRGIALEDARKILIEAYLDEALNKIDEPQIRQWIKDKFAA